MSEVTLERIEGQGMLLLRGDLENRALTDPVAERLGLEFPGVRRAVTQGAKGAIWMSPDEALIFVTHDEVPATLDALRPALSGQFALLEDMSDARAVFEIEGDWSAEVLGKLMPLDLHPDRFGPGSAARSHLGQIAAAVFCLAPGRYRILCFRSVARYAHDLLADAIAAGRVGHFPAA